MADTNKNGKRIFTNTLKLVFQNGLSLLLGQGIILFFFLFAFTPLISRIYQLALIITGFRFVTVDNLGLFLLKPISIIMIILLFFIIGLFLQFEIYYLIINFSLLENGKKTKFYKVILLSFYKMVIGIGKGNLKLIPSVWIICGIFNLPLFFFLLKRIRIIRFFTDEISFRILVAGCILAVVILLGAFLFRKSFLIHFFLVENKTYQEAAKKSRDIKSNKPLKTFLYFVGWNCFLFLAILILYSFTMAVTALLVSGAFSKGLAIAAFASINDNINGYLIFMTFTISMIGNFALYTHLFYDYKLPAGMKGIYVRIPDAHQLLKIASMERASRWDGPCRP